MRSEFIKPVLIEHCLAALTPANALVCRVCLHTGLRIGDVLELRTVDLARRMTITEKKTGKKRRVCLPGDLYNSLVNQAGSVFVFEGRDDPNKHRTRQAVWKDIKRAARAFRVRGNFCPHSLRKVYAVELYRKYGDIQRVKRALNHDNDVVTAIYALADVLKSRT